MTQKTVGLLHLPGLQQPSDVGGADPDTFQSLLRHHGEGQTLLPAEPAQQIGVSLPLPAEAEIVAADEACGFVGAHHHS